MQDKFDEFMKDFQGSVDYKLKNYKPKKSFMPNSALDGSQINDLDKYWKFEDEQPDAEIEEVEQKIKNMETGGVDCLQIIDEMIQDLNEMKTKIDSSLKRLHERIQELT